MVLTFRFFMVFLIVAITRARPSRLKILPGLAFYRTEDNQSENENSLMEKDKDLLRSMWNIVDKMDYKSRDANVPTVHTDSMPQPGDHGMDSMRKMTSIAPKGQKSNLHNIQQQHHPNSHGAKIPPLGTPITTINVFSTYPATLKGDQPYPQYQASSYGATPFSSSSNSRNSQNMMHHTNSHFEKPNRNPYEQFIPNSENQNPFDHSGVVPSDNLMSQRGFSHSVDPNSEMALAHAFEHQMDNSEMNDSGFETLSRDEMGNDFTGGMNGGMIMEHPSDSEPMQFMMPQLGGSDSRSFGEMMHEMPDNLRQHGGY